MYTLKDGFYMYLVRANFNPSVWVEGHGQASAMYFPVIAECQTDAISLAKNHWPTANIKSVQFVPFGEYVSYYEPGRILGFVDGVEVSVDLSLWKKRRLSEQDIISLVSIGFCQPKFYKPTVWRKAKQIMEDIAIPHGLVFRFDHGRGKGKYSTAFDIDFVKNAVLELLTA